MLFQAEPGDPDCVLSFQYSQNVLVASHTVMNSSQSAREIVKAGPEEDVFVQSGEAIILDCQCRGDMAMRHRTCAEKWVHVKVHLPLMRAQHLRAIITPYTILQCFKIQIQS